MNEGLIVLSQGGDILSINASAARLFQVSGEQLQGQKLIALNRSDQLAQVAEQALAGKPALIDSVRRRWNVIEACETDTAGRLRGAALAARTALSKAAGRAKAAS